MVEEDAVAGVEPVGLAVVHCDPVAVELGHGVGTARIERCSFLLRDLLHQSVQLTGAGLVDAGLLLEAKQAHGFQNP